MNSIENKIFHDLYKASEGLMIFTFHTRYLLTPAQVYKFTAKYSKLEYIEVSDIKIELTNKGRQFIIGAGLDKEETNIFEKIPFQFINQNKIKINEFYAPIKDKLDKKKFKSIFEEKEG